MTVTVKLELSFAVYEVLEVAAKFSGMTVSRYVSELVRHDCLQLRDHDMDIFSEWIKDTLKDEEWVTKKVNTELVSRWGDVKG